MAQKEGPGTKRTYNYTRAYIFMLVYARLCIRRKFELDSVRLVDYALRIDIGAVIRRLGYLMELYEIGTSKHRNRLQERMTETVVRLEPLLPAEGKLLHKWRLQLNVTPEELHEAVRI